MHSQIEALFDEAENRYLKPEELGLLNQYVNSIPARMTVYQALRDRELEIMQPVADQLQAALPQESLEALERAVKNGLLALRYCAMAMLLNDEKLVGDRLSGWLGGTMSLYNNPTINGVLYSLMQQRLTEVLGAQAMSLLAPHLQTAQAVMNSLSPQASSAS